jgi:PAS domain S-box-containing protein
VDLLLRVVPGWTPMKANAAVCFIALGVALWLRRRERPTGWKGILSGACTLLVVVIGLLTLAEVTFGLRLGIDELLLKQSVLDTHHPYPARMSPVSAAAFLVAGAGLFLLDRPTHRLLHPTDVCANLILLGGMVSLVGHLYGVEALYHISIYSSMAIHTGFGLILLAVGLLFARPDRGFARIFTRGSAGAVLARRLLPAAILLPVVLGWLRVEAQRAGYFELGFGSALFATALVVLLVALTWWTSLSLDRMDVQRAVAERARESLALLPQQNPAPVLRLSREGTILYANGAAAPLLGAWNLAIGQPAPEGLRTLVRDSLQAKQIRNVEFELATTTYLLTVAPVPNQDYVNLYGTDLTERKRAEQQIRRTQDDLQRALAFDEAIVLSMGEGLYTVDVQGLVSSMNPAAEKLFGWTFAELRGRKMHDWTHHHHPDGHPFPAEECSGLRVLQQGKALTAQEDVFIRKDGTFFDVVYSSSPIREGGAITGLVVVFRDVSDRKRSEQELRTAHEMLADRAKHLQAVVDQRTAKLQETIGELEAFSYSVSHDLRAPLRAVKSFSMILQEEEAPRLSAQAKDYLRRIIEAAERMDRLIRDVLDYSRVVRSDLPMDSVNMENLIRGIIESYPHVQDSRAEIEVVGRIPEVLGNEAALTQCLSNLLGNAVKFVAPGVTPSIRIWAETQGGNVTLNIKDNGIGIPKEFQETIFGIFRRLHPDYEGTGIGLSIVKKAVERMGGSISVRSEPGHGSTFLLTLKQAGLKT